MDFKQGSIVEMLDSERQMVLSAPERFGAYYEHAFECTIFLTHFVKTVDPDRWIFASFLSQVKKYHTLALFSTVRLHQIQSAMNLRHVLGAGALAAFAIANPDPANFVAQDHDGYLNHPKKLTKKAYDWLDQHYPGGSSAIKDMKTLINKSTAHANMIYAANNFKTRDKERVFFAPFFDFEDAYYVKTDLWRIGNVAIGLLDLFCGVNQSLNVIKFADDFSPEFQKLDAQRHALRAEMTSTERFRAAMARAAKSSTSAPTSSG
jgi:hypothetical protein